jgi:hypothetical protein
VIEGPWPGAQITFFGTSQAVTPTIKIVAQSGGDARGRATGWCCSV